MPKINKIYAVWVYTKDLDASKNFYEEVLGFKFKKRDGDWIEFDLGETSFALLKRHHGEEITPQKTHTMLEASDLETAQKELEKKGVKFVGEIRRDSYGNILTFQDPNGHWLELFEPK